MPRTILAMSREFVRCGWRTCVAMLACAVVLPILMIAFIRLKIGPVGFADEYSTLPLHFIFLLMSLIMFGAAAMNAQNGGRPNAPRWLRNLPVSSALIVGCRTLCGAATVGTLFFITAMAYEWFLGVRWPTLGPALFLMTSYMWLEALYWSLRDFRWWMPLLYSLLVIGMVRWMGARYVFHGGFQPSEFWDEVTAGEMLTLALWALAGFVMAVNGMARDRRGDARGAERLAGYREAAERLIKPRWERLRPAPPPQSTAGAALFHMDWTRCAVGAPAVLAALHCLVLLVGFTLWIFDRTPPHVVLETLGGFGLAAAVVLPFAFAFLSRTTIRHQAAFPVSDQLIARTKLRAAACGFLSVWLILALAILIAILWVWLAEGVQPLRMWVESFRPLRRHRELGGLDRNITPELWVAVVVLISCSAQGIGTACALSRRNVLWGTILYGLVFGLPMMLIVLDEKLIGVPAAFRLRALISVLIGVTCFTATVGAYVAAVRAQLIRPAAPVVAGICWGALLLAFNLGLPWRESLPPPIWILIAGLCALPVLAPAAVPLAVRSARRL